MTTFFVEVIPQTKGSTRAFTVKGKRFPIVTNDNPKNTVWARRVRREAQSQPGVTLVEVGPVTLEGVCYRNDAQVAYVRAGKFYSDRPGVSITVTEGKS